MRSSEKTEGRGNSRSFLVEESEQILLDLHVFDDSLSQTNPKQFIQAEGSVESQLVHASAISLPLLTFALSLPSPPPCPSLLELEQTRSKSPTHLHNQICLLDTLLRIRRRPNPTHDTVDPSLDFLVGGELWSFVSDSSERFLDDGETVLDGGFFHVTEEDLESMSE